MDYRYGNADFVEVADSYDDLHCAIRSMIWAYGAGDLVAIVWSKNDSPQVRVITGLAVTQCQYGQKAYRVTVKFDNDHYVVRMLRHQRRRTSDYFAP